ncbi:MAG: hypothetical protein RIC95_08815 [Vicingaceae bacterium]
MIGLCCSFLAACQWFNGQSNEGAVARVGDHVLYQTELEGLTNGESPEDSSRIVESYIDNWIKEELLIQKAELNLSEKQLDFEKQLENYRNSLVIYAYENLLIKQKLDTNVAYSKIQDYYQENKGNFELKEPIFRARYLDFLNSAPNQDSLKIWFTSEGSLAHQKMNDYCQRFTRSCQLDSVLWIPFSDWKEILPLDTNRQFTPLQIGFNEYVDSNRTVWVKVDQKIEAGEAAPVKYVASQIKSIILNRRRLKLIANVKQEIYEEATLKQKYEIY